MDKEEKEFLNKESMGIRLLQNFLPNFDNFTKSKLFALEIPYIIIKEMKDDIYYITSAVYDEASDALYILTTKGYYKFNIDQNILYMNDLPLPCKTFYFEDEDKIIKKMIKKN